MNKHKTRGNQRDFIDWLLTHGWAVVYKDVIPIRENYLTKIKKNGNRK
jgi:endonuclease YncB( thermonuclease family)